MESKKSSLVLSYITKKLFGPKMNYRLRYLHQRGHLPNFCSPNDISEILINQMFTPPLCVKCAPFVDKLAVRDYIRWKGYDDILLKHYGVWSRPQDVEFDKLPNKFALKCNNGCGHHIICHDKNQLDLKFAIEEMRKAILSGITSVEPHYHHITPRIYAEELIDVGEGNLPVDYKFTCIGGEIMDVFVATDRAKEVKYCTLDLNWQPLPYIKEEYRPQNLPARPEHLKELSEVAKALCQDFEFVRVDLYEYKEKPYISELTFFPWGGLFYGYNNAAIKFYGEKWHMKKKGLEVL